LLHPLFDLLPSLLHPLPHFLWHPEAITGTVRPIHLPVLRHPVLWRICSRAKPIATIHPFRPGWTRARPAEFTLGPLPIRTASRATWPAAKPPLNSLKPLGDVIEPAEHLISHL
jgi:hypothetical protein